MFSATACLFSFSDLFAHGEKKESMLGVLIITTDRSAFLKATWQQEAVWDDPEQHWRRLLEKMLQVLVEVPRRRSGIVCSGTP